VLRFARRRFLRIDVEVVKSGARLGESGGGGGGGDKNNNVIEFLLRGQFTPPTIMCIVGGAVVNHSSELGSFQSFSNPSNEKFNFVDPGMVESFLANCGVLNESAGVARGDLCEVLNWKEQVGDAFGAREQQELQEQKDVEYYDCGQTGCCKTFEHQHIGTEGGEAGMLLRDGVDAIHL